MYWPLSCWVSCESKHDTNPNYTKESIYAVVIFEPGNLMKNKTNLKQVTSTTMPYHRFKNNKL